MNEAVAIAFFYEHAKELTRTSFPLIKSVEGHPECTNGKTIEREILIHCLVSGEKVTVQLLVQGTRRAPPIQWRVIKAVSWKIIHDGNLQTAVWSEEMV